MRICKEIKRNWHRGEMKIANILLEGDAGSGKTQLAKALHTEKMDLPTKEIMIEQAMAKDNNRFRRNQTIYFVCF